MMQAKFENIIQQALVTGKHVQPLLVLWGMSVTTVIPTTFWKKLFTISVGYGCATATMSLVLMWAFDVPIIPQISDLGSTSHLLVFAALLYGVRLTSFFLLREATVKAINKQGDTVEKFSRGWTILLAIFVSFLYACFVLPILYALRTNDQSQDSAHCQFLQILGVGVCYVGLILESVADYQKYSVKRRFGAAYDETRFVGPTGGTYAVTRHPNYLGEILFWIGIYMASATSFGDDFFAWIFSTLGLWSIVSIMLASTKRLEAKHQDKYGDQEKFQEWHARVKAPLIPFVETNFTLPGVK